MTPQEIDQIKAIVQPLIGQRAWGTALGHGSFVTVEFGDPIEKSGETYGTWHLWIRDCAWRFDINGQISAGAADDRQHLAQAVKQIDGRSLIAIGLTATLDAQFTFENGLVLRLFPNISRDAEHWKLYTPEHKTLVAGPGNAWDYRLSDGSSG